MKLQIENNLTQDLLANSDLVKKTGSENGSAEVTEMLRSGIKAAQAGNRAEARQLLVQATEAEPENENAWLWLASISEYPEELLIFLSNVLRINPANERALEWEKSTKTLLSKTFVQRGINANKESQSDFARQCFFQAIVHDNQNEMAWLWLASISDAVEEKKSHLQKVLKINPANETALELLKTVKKEIVHKLLEKAKEAVADGENETADKMITDILGRAPETEDAWMIKARLTDSFSKKIGCLEKVLRINPDHEEAKSSLEMLRTVFQKTVPQIEEVEVPEPAHEPPPVAEAAAIEDENGEMLELEVSAKDQPEEVLPEEENAVQEVQPAETIAEEPIREVEFTSENYYAPEEAAAELPDHSDEDSIAVAAKEAGDLFYQETTDEIAAPEEAAEAVEEEATEAVEEEAAEAETAWASVGEEAEAEVPEEFESAEVQTSFKETEPNAAETEVFETSESDEAEEYSAAPPKSPRAETLLDCPFCSGANEPQDFICNSCHAMLTLSDVEMLLAHQEVDQLMLEKAVERMELEKNLHKFGAEELRSLGIGHINLKNLRKGFEYLQEAVYMNPNDVLLASQVNSLAIRLSEIEEQQNNHVPMPKNKTILVVDDSPTVRKLITGKLEKCGHEVICAADGMEALEKINEGIPDLILLDITMPRMDGYQVCKLIRGNDATRDIPVVMISGKDGFFDKVRGRMAGTTGYITKPFGPETLMKTVETYIN